MSTRISAPSLCTYVRNFLNRFAVWTRSSHDGLMQDITFGQIFQSLSVYGLQIPYPFSFLDWTMSLLSDGSWERISRTFSFAEPGGDYVLREVLNGQGKPGRYFKEWVQARGGQPIQYTAKRIFP